MKKDRKKLDSKLKSSKYTVQILYGAGISVGVLLVGILLFYLIKSFHNGFTWFNKRNIENLMNSSYDELNEAIFSNHRPSVFLCSNKEVLNPQKISLLSPIFNNLYTNRHNKYDFAVLNCSQIVSNGQTIWERFKLDNNTKPTIFVKAPWSNIKQIKGKDLKNIKSLEISVDNILTPKPISISSDDDLKKYCQSNPKRINTKDIIATNTESTCIIILKGTRYTKIHTDIESKLVQEYPKVKILSVDASKYRLSYESPDDFPADLFGLKLHAIRNLTHYQSMENPVTWDFVSTFVSYSTKSPLNSYIVSPNKNPISLLKVSSPVFQRKKKSSNSKEYDDSDDIKSDNIHKDEQKYKKSKPKKESTESVEDQQQQRTNRRKRKGNKNQQDDKKSSSSQSPDEIDIDDNHDRERIKREKMEKQSRERIFDETNEDTDDDHSDHDLESNDEIIEL